MTESGMFMMQTCIVGRQCEPNELDFCLTVSPFDVVVLVLSAAVADDDPVREFLMSASRTFPSDAHLVARRAVRGTYDTKGLRAEKHCYWIEDRVFLVVHRAKVRMCVYTRWATTTAVAGLDFGVVDVHLDTTRQRLPGFKLGIVYIGCAMDETVVEALAGMCVCGRVAMVTGWFGKGNRERVAALAQLSGATWKTPLYQAVRVQPTAVAGGRVQPTAVAGGRVLLHPSYFIIFGRYKIVKWPTEPTALPQEFPMSDLQAEMELASDHPTWPLYERGSPFVHNFGPVVMKPLDFSKVPGNCFQTNVWFGTAVPSQKSQLKAIDKSKAKGKGKFWGKRGSKAKGKGKFQ